MYTNAQSLFNKLSELEVMAVEQKTDIILVTETWCSENTPNASLKIEGYQVETELRKDREDTGRGVGGGLLVYVREGLKVIPTDKHSDTGFNQFCSFYIPTTSGQLELILVYRPPSSDAENVDKLCKILKNVTDKSIILGDFNLPGIHWETGTSDAKGRLLLETVEEEGMEQMVNFSTHIKGNVLDLLITNCPDRIIDINDIGRLGKSDHVVLVVQLDVGLLENKLEDNPLNWRRADFEGIRREMGETNWNVELQVRPMKEAWNWFSERLGAMIERHVPRMRKRSCRWPEWMTSEIMKLVKAKRRKWKRLKEYNTEANLHEYRKAVNTVNKKIRNAKRRMEREMARNEDNNNRRFARYIKSKTSGRTGVGPLRRPDGTVTNNDLDMARELNNYFVSVFTKEDDTEIPHIEAETADTLTRIIIRREDIKKGIRELRREAAPGPDGIRPLLLKETIDQITDPLEILFRKSLREGVVPEEWRTANVTPIYKKGPKGDPGNYRPVSLTSVPGKLLERIIKEQIMEFLYARNLIKSSQHGFVKGKSCTTNRLEFMERVTREVDRGKAVDVIYLDFSKAFDKVPHKKLIEKFRGKGIQGEPLRWMEKWLEDRRQRVVVNGEKSEWMEVLSGVPQGSVLGPTQFAVFIDDLEREIAKEALGVFLNKFADDTKGMKVVEGEEDRAKLQRALDLLVEWAEKWGMAFNAKKCRVMHHGPRNPCYEYYMGSEKLGTTDEETDLGIKVTRNLKPSQQCSKAAGRAKAVLGQLSRNFHYRDRHVFLSLYKRYVRPHLEFASPSWAPWLMGDVEALEDVQEKAVKMVTGLKARNYKERCEELKLESLAERREKQDLVEVYKELERMEEGQGGEMFTYANEGQEGIRTRASIDPRNLRVQYARTDQRKYSFGVRVVEKWNNLPAEVKRSRTLKQFKSALNRARGSNNGPTRN